MSPASRGRGLKLMTFNPINPQTWVARFTRAWIETRQTSLFHHRRCVARFTRAWIETPYLQQH